MCCSFADSITNPSMDSCSRRKFSSRLLRHHVLCIPVGPIRVTLADELFMLAVGGLRAPHHCATMVDANGKPIGAFTLLQAFNQDSAEQPLAADKAHIFSIR